MSREIRVIVLGAQRPLNSHEIVYVTKHLQEYIQIVVDTLKRITSSNDIVNVTMIHRKYPGVDNIAEKFANEQGWHIETFPKYNQELLESIKPNIVLGFPEDTNPYKNKAIYSIIEKAKKALVPAVICPLNEIEYLGVPC